MGNPGKSSQMPAGTKWLILPILKALSNNMSSAVKTYVKTLPRHYRLLIFVDSRISEKALRNVLQANLLNWGGRYNPVIPVYDNTISPAWLEVIRHFDPDFIYHSKNVDPTVIQKLEFFHPTEYIEMNDAATNISFPGVYINHLLHEEVYNNFYHQRLAILQHTGAFNMPLIARDFYRLNLGFMPLYAEDKKWLNRFMPVAVDEKNSADINQLIHDHKPYFKSLLSALHVDSVCLLPDDHYRAREFQWIVYEPANYFDDLIYFWNRQLFFEPSNKLWQVISTKAEITNLIADKWFAGLCSQLWHNHKINIVSRSLPVAEFSAIATSAHENCKHIQFPVMDIGIFPLEKFRAKRLESSFFTWTNNLVLDEKDFLRLPVLAFENGERIVNAEHCVDLVLERDTNDDQKEIQFPYHAVLHYLVYKGKSRINKRHRVTIFPERNKQGIEIEIPDDSSIILSVLQHRTQLRELIHLPVKYLAHSSDGQQLSAFFNLMDRNWHYVKEFIWNKFWLQVFRFDSELKDSAIKKGRGIFSQKDLENEVAGLFEKYRTDIDSNLRQDEGLVVDEELVNNLIERDKQEVFVYHINEDLEFLIKRGGLFLGMKVKCKRCGSNKWYSLTELRDRFNCKGCGSEIIPGIKSKIYYRLSDIIINNLLNDSTRESKAFHGNYVVMKTLLHLKAAADARESFAWCPQLEYMTNDDQSSDIDILAIQNGRLVIGEAKPKPSDFSRTVKDNIVWMANHLLPDKIILACNAGGKETTSRMEALAQEIHGRITQPHCEVITYVASPPWYQYTGVFYGLPNEREEA